MKAEAWMELARAMRAQGQVVTPTTVREAALDSGLAAELLGEKAATLGRLGEALDAAIARLAALREAAALPGADLVALRVADRQARSELARLRWERTVVSEAMGLRGVRADLDRFWPVPAPL